MIMSHTGRENLESYLIEMKCQDDRLDNLNGKDFIRQTVIGQAQKFCDEQRSEKPNPKRTMGHARPLGYIQEQANIHMGNVTGCYYGIQTKTIFNDLQYT